MATSVVHITSQSSSRGYKVRQTRPAKSTWLIRKEQRRRRDEVDRVIQRQLTLPAISGTLQKKSFIFSFSSLIYSLLHINRNVNIAVAYKPAEVLNSRNINQPKII